MNTSFYHLIDFYSFYDMFYKIFESLGFSNSASWMSYLAAGGSLSFLAINLLVLSTAFYTWFERRTIARFQVRRGPNRNGPFGLGQPFADVIKLIMKEDTVPTEADKPVFTIAPIALLAPTLLIITVIPIDDSSFLATLNIGILFIVGITSVNSIAIFMAGWGSRNKYAILGSMRGAAMLISYEIPMALGITSVLLISGSLAMTEIVAKQDIWFIVVMPMGFFVFMAAATAEMSRTPFDQIEAESELGSGYNTEFSGIKFAILFLAEFMAPIVTSAVVTTLFLGGSQGFDFLPGQIWFILKMFVVIFILLWIRSTWPRLRIDQIMGFAWKILMELGFINIFLIAIEVAVLMDPVTGLLTPQDMLIMAGINWVFTIITLLVLANFLGKRNYDRPDPVPSPLANMQPKGEK
ncbi:MAG: NADH-quinone oxidoreductase subunit NuoH [Dehalococcoidia bacterium]|tara:strand:+ start:1291 stop:2517 length:1227 start_codon:yes stop_codon:yes gene_type:complete